MDLTLSWEERYKQLEAHHLEETKFLIKQIEFYEDDTNIDKDGKVHCYCCDASPI